MKKLLSAMALMIAVIGPAAMSGIVATAQAQPIAFEPDWPDHPDQTQHTICAALAQGWSRAQIVDAAEYANDMNLTGLSVVQAAQRADAMIDAAHDAVCPTLNVD
ncbi:hypothetical protein MB901379_01371 [Mycobacterium basiliense]|uniref:DUF732 domain-containing protein n=1 Tax=Mycobacterium basiliense TaxID=2094119 RepID=A0A447GBG8_9MYCO|nr:hypothetical protein [Mycobacterium basiliense]VDM87821.1 hypothetical protein MB901379_01371 [Mycobacterium basiliense]